MLDTGVPTGKNHITKSGLMQYQGVTDIQTDRHDHSYYVL